MIGRPLQNVRMCALTQTARRGLSTRIKFASANNMFNSAVCFCRPRYRVFRKRSCCFTTTKTCSTLARIEDFSCSLRLICALDRLELCLLWDGRRLMTHVISCISNFKYYKTLIPAWEIRVFRFSTPKMEVPPQTNIQCVSATNDVISLHVYIIYNGGGRLSLTHSSFTYLSRWNF